MLGAEVMRENEEEEEEEEIVNMRREQKEPAHGNAILEER